AMVDKVLKQLSRRFDAMYSSTGRLSIPPEQLLRAQLLQMLYSIRSERVADGRDRLQRVVPLVYRIELGRRGVGRDGVQQEPRSLAGSQGGQGVSGACRGAGASQGPDLGRAFHGGRHAAGGVGGGEEFSSKGQEVVGSARRSGQSHGKLSRRATVQRDA